MGLNSSHEMAAPVIVASRAKHTASLIFLHGLGDTGHGWAQAFTDLGFKHIRCVCPTAPVIPVTLNGGMRMPSWFDIIGLTPDSKEDTDGIKKASDTLQRLISEEEKIGIPSNRIVVGGFSQGGAVALYSAFSNRKPLAGVVGLSTWLPLHKQFPAAVQGNRDIPILQCHGEADPLVPHMMGNLTGTLLKTFNKKHNFKSYPGLGHSSCEPEMRDVKTFLEETLVAV